MVTDDVWRSIVMNLDDPATVQEATNTLGRLIERSGENAPAIAAKLAPMARDLNTALGRSHALSVLAPYAPNVPEVFRMTLEMSHDEDPSLRRAALALLVRTTGNSRARDRVLELVSDPDATIRNVVLSAVREMELEGEVGGAAYTLRVIPDHNEREGAIQLLDELERAVKTLQDLGLDEGQDLIVNQLLLPKIEELRKLFGAASEKVEQVAEQRKRGLLNLGMVAGSAKALALGTTAVANADEAAKTVIAAAEKLSPVVDMFGRLL